MESRIYTDGIPPGHATNETWRLHRRQAAKGVRPAGYFRPPDFVPEVYGCPLGIPLFTHQQTTDYRPTPATVAGQQFYDVFVGPQNRRRLLVWFDGVGKNGRRQKPGWRSFDQYLSRAKIREHLRGRTTYAAWGNELTNWFELDVDHHGGDGRYFLGVLEALQDLPAFFPDWRWAYSIRRDDLTGVHVIGLLPDLSRMDVIRADLLRTLAYLEEEALERLRPFKNPKVPDDQFAPLTGLEISPRPTTPRGSRTAATASRSPTRC